MFYAFGGSCFSEHYIHCLAQHYVLQTRGLNLVLESGTRWGGGVKKMVTFFLSFIIKMERYIFGECVSCSVTLDYTSFSSFLSFFNMFL